MTPNGQIAITLDKAAIREPFVIECNGALSGAAYRNALGFYTVSAIREPSTTVAYAFYIRSVSAPLQNPWVMCKT